MFGEFEDDSLCVCETELSALDLSCSDQLKPLPSPFVPFAPGLPPFVLARRACAPNDMCRVKGVVGTLRAGPGPSSSSIALSSIESERSVETLPLRAPNGNGADEVGDEPDKPRVEIDIRRRWSCAAVVIGPAGGNGAVGLVEVLFDRPKMLLKVCVVKEPLRARVAGLVEVLS